MVRARQWLIPTLDGVPFIDKPVLYHWLQETAECAEYSREIRPGSRLLSNLWAWLVRQAKNLLPYVPLH
jgi:4-amino-4-deoxy-L-arabinose transferase-like glycosyltransferase